MIHANASRSGKSLVWLGLILAAIAGAGGLAYWLTQREPRAVAAVDMIAALKENNLGCGNMDRFDYRAAITHFEKVGQLAPAWLPGRVNLGIALLNGSGTTESEADRQAMIARCIDTFEKILRDEPKNPYALFCLGIMAQDRGELEKAASYFEDVLKIDPQDANSWYRLGATLPAEDPRVAECFQKAVKLDPYLSAAIYGHAMLLRQTDMKAAKSLLQEHEQLKQALWENAAGTVYSEMGPYAEVIGKSEASRSKRFGPLPLYQLDESFRVALAPGTRFATRADLKKAEAGELLAGMRERFGGCLALLDFNGDAQIDLFLVAAVVEQGKVRDLLLRNDGNGLFTDVTREAGLGQPAPAIGCSLADYDNDGRPDLLLTGAGQQHLWRNAGNGKFEDVSKAAGLDAIKTVCLSGTWVDLDQDGDLDLVLPVAVAPGGFKVLLNIGESPVVIKPNDEPPALTTRFKLLEGAEAFSWPGKLCSQVLLADLDSDQDLDLVCLTMGESPRTIINDRLLRFQGADLAVADATASATGLSFDQNQDDKADLFLLSEGKLPLLLLNASRPGRRLFERGVHNGPILRQAQAIDVDLDGWPDVLGLSTAGKPVLLQNLSDKLALAPQQIGSDEEFPSDLIAAIGADLRNACVSDVLLWSESKGLELRKNLGNGNRGVRLQLTGHRRVDAGGLQVRCNADAIGARVTAQASDVHTAWDLTTPKSGFGQSMAPLLLGLGKQEQPDVVRIRWPDGVWQAEFNIASCTLARIHETNRKTTSCPVLFTWNGERWVFVTDFLGAGNMGELQPDGTTRPPRPEESILLDSSLLRPKDGRYCLKVAEPMDEITYLDKLQLLAVDHPASLRVAPDERFAGAGPAATQDLLLLGEAIFPARAIDHLDRDRTSDLMQWDRRMVDGFRKRTWLGFAEDHFVILDFGDRLRQLKPTDPMILCLVGWTDYAYPESIWAASQAGIEMRSPCLDRQRPDGTWETILPDIGFPAGLPRLMTVDVTGLLTGPSCRLRLRTNLHVYWDQAYLAPLTRRVPALKASQGGLADADLRINVARLVRADLRNRGSAQEFSPDGKLPTLYDHDRIESLPAAGLNGFITRTGDVIQLLHESDDRFVIFGPGDEITLECDAASLPALPIGWQRSFVLRTWGYCKDSGPFTATGSTVEPLPFRGMTAYPYGDKERFPDSPLHRDYLRTFNTRSLRTRR